MSYQQPDFFRFGTDSLWLVEIVKTNTTLAPIRVLELGAGSGVISCELAQIFPQARFCCVEIQDDFMAFLKMNLEKYALNRFEIVQTTVKAFNAPSSRLFDLIVFNPPYFESEASRPSPNLQREICRKHVIDSWEDWIECASRSLAPKGAMYWVHREAKSTSNKLKVEKLASNGELGVWRASALDVE